MENIALIRKKLSDWPESELYEFIELYKNDTRIGVKHLVESAYRKSQKYEAELVRIRKMRAYEDEYPDCRYICGVDEVGRGPLAGPVFAGAVVLPKDCIIPYVNDSKQLTAAKREQLAAVIRTTAVSIGLGSVDNKEIDRINILEATREAMRKAIAALTVKPDIILTDAVFIPGIDIPQKSIIKGDAKSISIAAASIVAKVVRDRYMTEIGKQYPEYDFERNKGYGSAEHFEALREYGLCPLHRKTFIHL